MTNNTRKAELQEKRECRMAIVPYLQAEKDRMLIAKLAKAEAEEAEIMKGRKDWKVGESVYSSKKRWQAPTVGLRS